jgi:hypothetical protein
MFDGAAAHSDLGLQLPADAYWHLVHTLRLTLPPPGDPGHPPGPEDLLRRDRAAIARVAEADLAAQFVAASEQWKECLRLAQAPETTPDWAGKCRAQALAMMRQANATLRLLLRLQQARRKLEGDNAAGDRLAWTEHCALGLMAEALAQPPAAATATAQADRAQADRAQADGAQADRAQADGEQAAAAKIPAGPDEAEAELVAAAERYAAAYPERAAQIRRTGRLPHDVRHFSPPEAALARALVSAHTPALAALDGPLPHARAA